ncbi:LPS export ABC transporter ATP-binding protein [Brevundimonas subvibrioides]|uniref:Lipopolysaccharide export system ATP-binding protein LptB n=1 Tax=Brevundimonas subvibrioides (strain ATCC 15264 / DSM 4735 / LMG 14903 / NBRC 16000 / CB 81) TaxID=633149 RepID=D9QM03_BRESC|nr:LPS export ABC transporter ATP-binding protein [Brevundimonas subvibrioides]ADL00087.1 ABC transporter related protein [Brevundimonas subvibrioides ATCC 15264]
MARKELSALNLDDRQAAPIAPAAVPARGLRVQNIARAFGARQVVADVSLTVQRGEVAGLLGPNGAGKTTCFYMITGLIPPDSGSIWLDGEDITAQPMYQRSRMGLGYLAQEASIFRGMTVEDNIKSVVELRESGKAIEVETTRLLEELNIQHLRHAPATGLSGGERRRVEIARSLAGKPSFMLLDEPFAGIDPLAIADIRQVIRYLAGEGIGVLITDHNVRETLDIIDRASIISNGAVLFEGTADEVIHDPEVRRVYLGDLYG